MKVILLIAAIVSLGASSQDPRPLAGTAPLKGDADLASEMVAGIDRFLLKEIEASVERRAPLWKRDPSSPAAYVKSIQPNRERFRQYIGAADARVSPPVLEHVATSDQPALVGRLETCEVFAVRWPVLRGVEGEGLLLLPRDRKPLGDLVVIPDADQTPELLAGLEAGADQPARLLAEAGFRVIVPVIIDRADTYSASSLGRTTNQPHREFAYRPAFEMGRHIIGYEVQKILAAVDILAKEGAGPIGVVGTGEGGLLALYAGALDPRIQFTCVRSYFESRQEAWQEPIYRNVWGLLEEFGDAEIASLIAPREFSAIAGPPIDVKGPTAPKAGRSGAAPGRWTSPSKEATAKELARLQSLIQGLKVESTPFSTQVLKAMEREPSKTAPVSMRAGFDPRKRLKRQFDQIIEDTQSLLRDSEDVRRSAVWNRLDTKTPEGWKKTVEPFREQFYSEVIGRFDKPLLPSNVRSRLVYDEPKYAGYEVMLDVFPDVFAYGVLLVPKDLKEGERRPVVVCQHGLEGRPQDVADPKKLNKAYNQYACRLAERGFVTYAPQNPYIFTDRFRTLQRKANLLRKSLFSIIVPQHQQTVDWLATLPFVDPDRIAFYGLSYGGKTAMRVPPLISRYCLSICSADFNEWIWKNVSTRSPYSYVTTGEYEIFEWNLGHTFNYAEMAALIAPRPFMVERGHHDGVAPDEKVAYEYAKVRRLYTALKIPDRTTIEFFDGPHSIHGVGTFEFLHEHLKWPKPSK